MQQTKQFLESLIGIDNVMLDEDDEEYELTVWTTDYDKVNDFIDWEMEVKTTPEHHVLTFTRDKHKIDAICVMAPHVFTPDSENLNEMDIGDEERSCGFHREVAWVDCECGKRFPDIDEFQAHK